MAKAFDWYEEDGPPVAVIPEVRAVAVYVNTQDDIVIRQQAGPQDEDDAIVIVPKQYAGALLQALQDLLASD